jgi:hypothetical protein
MYRHDPLMRPLLSQFQTPTAPRRAVGFFRSGRLAGCPALLITQSTLDWLILLCQPFRPSTGATLNRAFIKVNANFWCNAYPQRCEKLEAQIAVRGNLTLSYYQFTRLLHIKLHKRVPIGKR